MHQAVKPELIWLSLTGVVNFEFFFVGFWVVPLVQITRTCSYKYVSHHCNDIFFIFFLFFCLFRHCNLVQTDNSQSVPDPVITVVRFVVGGGGLHAHMVQSLMGSCLKPFGHCRSQKSTQNLLSLISQTGQHSPSTVCFFSQLNGRQLDVWHLISPVSVHSQCVQSSSFHVSDGLNDRCKWTEWHVGCCVVHSCFGQQLPGTRLPCETVTLYSLGGHLKSGHLLKSHLQSQHRCAAAAEFSISRVCRT